MSRCFAATYYAWGAAALDVRDAREIWHRSDLKRFNGVAALPHQSSLVCWFEGKAGLTLNADTGASLERHVGLHGLATSRFDSTTLRYGKRVGLTGPHGQRAIAPRSFAMLACAFSPELCLISESTIVRAKARTSSASTTRPGFVALEYAYTDGARQTGPMLNLLHLDNAGGVVFSKAVREWSEAVLCAGAELMLNGLGELYDVETGEVTYVFDFPR